MVIELKWYVFYFGYFVAFVSDSVFCVSFFVSLQVLQPMPRPNDKQYYARMKAQADSKQISIEEHLPSVFEDADFDEFYRHSDPIKFLGFEYLLKIGNLPQRKGVAIESIVRDAMMDQFQSFEPEIAQWKCDYINKTDTLVPITSGLAEEILKFIPQSKLKIKSKFTTMVCFFFFFFI